MSANMRRILDHPDRAEIIKLLTEGLTPQKIHDMLLSRYGKAPEKKKFVISTVGIEQFANKHLNIKSKIAPDIKKAYVKANNAWIDDKTEQSELLKTSAYRQAIQDLVSQEMDARNELIKIFKLVESRLEVFYNRLESKEKFEGGEERMFSSYMDQLMRVMEQYRKFIESPNQTEDINVNISVATNQVNLIREAIRETFIDCDPALAVKFMEKVHSKMQALSLNSPNEATTAFLSGAMGNGPTSKAIEIMEDLDIEMDAEEDADGLD